MHGKVLRKCLPCNERGSDELMQGTETLLCMAVLLFGSVGMFVMFLVTDKNAVDESQLPEHATERRDEVSKAS
jgi:hypothetical protein